VGWDTIKKTIQSYQNGTHTPTKTYERIDNRSGAVSAAHEFFDRVAYFHDETRKLAKTDPKVLTSIPLAGRNLTGRQALRSLPDKGKILDEHFTVKTTPIAITNSLSPQVAAPLTSVSQPAEPTVSHEEEIRTLQAEIKALQEQYGVLSKSKRNEAEAIRLSNQLVPLKNRLNELQGKQ
jgi:hypothetical protein